MQKKMFRDAFDSAGFTRDKHIGIEIRNMNTEQVVNRIREVVSEREQSQNNPA
jgi:broad-specificity NMP kinase